jgi:beta-phosphoglucomutase-like phosphatase (HAD superfamily)
MHLVMFDIDGTLTATDDVDTECYVRAVGDVLGFANINTDWSVYPHCSDSGILETLCHERLGRPPTRVEVAAVQSRFMTLLASATRERSFPPIDGARELLDTLIATPGIALAMASGGWECSARLKLASAGLASPQIPAAFADDAPERTSIMQIAFARAEQTVAGTPFLERTYIGDGVWDSRAARELGFRFIGIAHDGAKIDRLRAEGATDVFPDYRNPTAVLAALRS